MKISTKVFKFFIFELYFFVKQPRNQAHGLKCGLRAFAGWQFRVWRAGLRVCGLEPRLEAISA